MLRPQLSQGSELEALDLPPVCQGAQRWLPSPRASDSEHSQAEDLWKPAPDGISPVQSVQSLSGMWRMLHGRHPLAVVLMQQSVWGGSQTPEAHTQPTQSSPSQVPTAHTVRGTVDSCGVLEVLGPGKLQLQLVQTSRTFHLRPLPIELHQSSLAKKEGMVSFVDLLSTPWDPP